MNQVFIRLSILKLEALFVLTPLRISPFNSLEEGLRLSNNTSESDSLSDNLTLPNGTAKRTLNQEKKYNNLTTNASLTYQGAAHIIPVNGHHGQPFLCSQLSYNKIITIFLTKLIRKR